MNNAVVVGPFVLPYALLLAFAAVASTLYVGKRSGRKAGIEVEPALWQTLLVLLVVARLVFVWEFRLAYWASPLDILDIRDGGGKLVSTRVGGLSSATLTERLQALTPWKLSRDSQPP